MAKSVQVQNQPRSGGLAGFWSHDPFRSLHREMDRLLEGFFGDDAARQAGWGGDAQIPAVNVAETDNGIEVTADLPGVAEKDINVSFKDGVLSIRGETEKQTESKDEKTRFHRIERSYGSFERSILLPPDVDPDKASASLRNGVLTVQMPKTEQARAKVHTIPVK